MVPKPVSVRFRPTISTVIQLGMGFEPAGIDDPAAIDAVRQIHPPASGRDHRIQACRKRRGVVRLVVAHRSVIEDIEHPWPPGVHRRIVFSPPCSWAEAIVNIAQYPISFIVFIIYFLSFCFNESFT